MSNVHQTVAVGVPLRVQKVVPVVNVDVRLVQEFVGGGARGVFVPQIQINLQRDGRLRGWCRHARGTDVGIVLVGDGDVPPFGPGGQSRPHSNGLVVGRVGVGVVALVVEAVALFVGVFYCVVKGGGGGV